jgi:NhaA family Na+:H+ antiporter
MHSSSPRSKRVSVLRQLLISEAGGGLILVLAAALALIAANSPASSVYFGTLKSYVAGLSILHWINDGLMAIFFLLVGLEIKREFLEGQLATWPRRILPGVAAMGGMIVPAGIYFVFNMSGETARGWAIPTATDIAFALGALALLGSRIPVSLKIFLTALAILDDLAAVAIIALFYGHDLSPWWLAGAATTISVLVGMNYAGVRKLTPYLALGALLWFFTLKSGVHATLAGVALAVTIPLSGTSESSGNDRPLLVVEHTLRPWVAYLIVPVFGFANAGVSFLGMEWSVLLTPVTLGVTAGLFAGKQFGVFAATWIVVKLKLAAKPDHATWAQLYGIALLCGIGFTMSLFIGLLAFPNSTMLQDEVKVGVLLGSVLSGIVGLLVLSVGTNPNRQSD